MSFEITNNVEIKIDLEVEEFDDEMEAMIDCDDGIEFEIERVDDFIDCPFDEMNDDDDDDDDDDEEGKFAVFSVEIELNEVGKVDELNDVDGTGEIEGGEGEGTTREAPHRAMFLALNPPA